MMCCGQTIGRFFGREARALLGAAMLIGLISPVAFAQGPIPAGANITIIPHSAFGGGFLTRQFITNLTSNVNALTINRINQAGTVVSTTNPTLQAGGTLLIADTESQRSVPITVQWFAIASQFPIAASVLFDFDGSALTPPFRTAVGALSATSLTAFTVPIRVATSNVTVGVALANLANSSNVVNLRLVDQNGVVVANDSITLDAFSQTAFNVHQRPAFASLVLTPAQFIGTLTVTSANPMQSVAAIAVGNNLNQLFSLPVTAGTAN